jgi:hypothetical protein
MKQIFLAVLLLFAVGCKREESPQAGEITQLRRENAQLTHRLKAVEDELAASQKHATASEDLAQALFERVKRIELVMGDRLYATPHVSAGQPNVIDAVERVRQAEIAAQERVQPMDNSAPATSASISSGLRREYATDGKRASPQGVNQAQFMDANRFVDAKEKIGAFCAREWPTDARMQAHCAERQSAAAVVLDSRGKPFGMDRPTFEKIRVDCFRQWGGDYRMRLHCEDKAFQN